MANYNYCGSGRWSARERQQFRRAWRVHRKQFHLLKSAVSVVCLISLIFCLFFIFYYYYFLLQVDSKSMPEMIEYYYTWKKYCSDEYRGRSRHFSEEVTSFIHYPLVLYIFPCRYYRTMRWESYGHPVPRRQVTTKLRLFHI